MDSHRYFNSGFYLGKPALLPNSVSIFGDPFTHRCFVPVLLTDKLKGKWDFFIGSICGTMLCYSLFGYGMFAFTLFTILSALKRKQNYVVIYGMIPVALALPPLAARKYLVIPSQAYSFPATLWYGTPDFENERILGLNTEDYFENWDKINELVHDGVPGNAISVCYNLANAMQNNLPESLWIITNRQDWVCSCL